MDLQSCIIFGKQDRLESEGTYHLHGGNCKSWLEIQIVRPIPFGKLKEIRLSLEAMQFLHL